MVPIDLRSDTVTQPTPAMRQAMAGAEVGDDVYGEDPTVKKLERQVAALLGKERALFVPSGTMANQIALMLHTRRGDKVVIGEGTHCAEYESGAAAALSGVQLAVAGTGGLFDVPELDAKIRPSAYWLPRTSLLVVENTHNRGGGRVFPLDQLRAVTTHARARGLAVHLDGARLWNASAASGVRLDEFAATADTVSICFSKGLGAPVGSALVGPSDLLEHALRLRRMLGGSMRQCGVLAAAALFAIEHHRARLTDDHEHAQLLARGLSDVRGARVDLRGVETNIVNIELDGPSAERVIARAKELGVLIGSIAPRFLRAVTHLDVSRDAATRAAAALAAAITDCHAT